MRKAAAPSMLAVVVALAGCGQQQRSNPAPTPQPSPVTSTGAPQAHPQAIEPAAGAVSPAGAGSGAPASVSVGPASTGSGSNGLAQPVSDAVVRRELAASGLSANSNQATMTPDGLAIAPVNAPYPVQEVISAGNEIAHLPYVWGGGHARYIDTGYDCSGSLSFVFAAAGLLNTTMTSGQLMSWGRPGPGKWITVFAAPGHTFMYVAGLRFDTVALAQTGSRWSNRRADESNLNQFVVRHPPGM